MSECSGPGCPTCHAPVEQDAPFLASLREIVARAYAEAAARRAEAGE